MPKCIYCRHDLNENDPPDDMTKSWEHIVPLAMGGSNQFTTWDTSSKYNHEFGSSIDAAFMNQPLIAIQRHMLSLRGHGRTVPPIKWEGRSMDNNEPIRIVINHDGSVLYQVEPIVIPDPHKNYTHQLVAGSPEAVRPIFAGMLKKAQAKGQRIYTEHGDALSSVAEMEATADVELTDLMRFRIKPIDYEIWVRGIVKIALGLCHVMLGEEWTFSTDGDRLRSILFVPRSQWPQGSLKAIFANRVPPETERLLSITPAVRAAKCHTLAVIPGERPLAVVFLFGGDAIFESMIDLGSERGVLTPHMLLSDPAIGVRIDPQTRKVETIRASDLVRTLPP
jgi:hypothetical protein